MTKESRLLYLAGLSLCIFACWGFFKDGSFIFPFPLNSFIFLAVTFQFTLWHHKKGLPIFLFLLTAIFGVLANPVFWEIIFSYETLVAFDKYPYMFWFQFLNGLGLVLSSFYLINKQKRHFTSLLTTAGILLFSTGFYTGIGHYSLAGLGVIALSVLIRPTYTPLHLFWILLFMLQLTQWITFTFA